MDLPPVTASTVRTWAARGKVEKYGLDYEGKRLYELVDIVQVAHANNEASGRGVGQRANATPVEGDI